MKVVFRADASIKIGTGHVMRCLTLAEVLKKKGAECYFACREHSGNLLNHIAERGFPVTALSGNGDLSNTKMERTSPKESYRDWLGCDWRFDAQQTTEILSEMKPDWLVVDHYALGHAWESAQREHAKKLMVIDDLANRSHNCDLLLDQNLGRNKNNYYGLIPKHADILVGPKYALLRPEFASLREYSLKRRKNQTISNIFVSMGGVDEHNATGKILESLGTCVLPVDCTISIVLGKNAPWLDSVRRQAAALPWHTAVLVNIDDMAQRMADSDLAIGAAGTTSWERCCLGLPSLIVVVAKNQQQGARALANLGAAFLISDIESFSSKFNCVIPNFSRSDELQNMSQVSSSVTDGRGAPRVACHMFTEADYQLYVRPAALKDEMFLYELANERLTRQNAFDSKPILISDHQDWFKKRLKKTDFCRIFIIESIDSIAIGQVRFEVDSNDHWEIDYAVLPCFRGIGLGKTILQIALEEFRNSYRDVTVVGKVKIENTPSSRIFKSLGFDETIDERAGISVYKNKPGEMR